MNARDQLLAALEAERFSPTPPHRVLPAVEPPTYAGGDTPGRIAARRLAAARELDPRFAGNAADLDTPENA